MKTKTNQNHSPFRVGATPKAIGFCGGNSLFVEQRSTANYYTPYKFSGKEKDEETSYSYFGARYYMSDVSVWLSVDPMWEERSWLSPYNYCQLNPIMLTDPTGMLDGEPDENMKYNIQPKDNFWNLEKEWGIPHGTLQTINPGVDPGNLQVGQQINAAKSEGGFIVYGNNVSIPSGQEANPDNYAQPDSPRPTMSRESVEALKIVFDVLSWSMMGGANMAPYAKSPAAFKYLSRYAAKTSPNLAVHGNSLKSLRPTWGYKLYSNDGTFLKNGITSKLVPETRYTKAFMSDKYMVSIKFPNRLSAYKWEFNQNMIRKGLLNFNNH